ncbi:MAG: ribokinase [Firmicutes bacterium]|nr:ribokinase [Bacillota bacterium]
MASVLVVGSLNMDLVAQVKEPLVMGRTVTAEGFAMVPGGKGANQAVAAARLGARVSLVGRVGTDAFVRTLLQSVGEAGVKSEGILQDDAASTGLALITVTLTAENTIVVIPGANRRLSPADIDNLLPLMSAAQVLLLQMEIPMETVIQAARQAKGMGKRVILDPSPARPLPDSLSGLVDIITPNETEAEVLTGHPIGGLQDAKLAASELLSRGFARVIMKLGAQGSLLGQPSAAEECATGPGWDLKLFPAFPVKAVDTTAAGDAFNAALAVALAEGRSLPEAVAFANAAGALATTIPGAQPSLPHRQEVEALLVKS